jgi:hypothetical protein
MSVVSLRACQFREDRRISHSFMALYGTKSSFMVHVPSSNAMLWNIDLLVMIFFIKSLKRWHECVLVMSHTNLWSGMLRIELKLTSQYRPHAGSALLFRSEYVGKSYLSHAMIVHIRSMVTWYTNDHIRSRIWWSESPILWQIERCHYRLHLRTTIAYRWCRRHDFTGDDFFRKLM